MNPRGLNTALELYRTGTLPVDRAARLAGCSERELRETAWSYGVGTAPAAGAGEESSATTAGSVAE